MIESRNKADLQQFFAAHGGCGDRWFNVLDGDVTLTCVCGASIVRTFDVQESPIYPVAFPGTPAGDADFLIIGAKSEAEARERAERLRSNV
jgi:hypothetical protein